MKKIKIPFIHVLADSKCSIGWFEIFNWLIQNFISPSLPISDHCNSIILLLKCFIEFPQQRILHQGSIFKLSNLETVYCNWWQDLNFLSTHPIPEWMFSFDAKKIYILNFKIESNGIGISIFPYNAPQILVVTNLTSPCGFKFTNSLINHISILLK